LVRFEARRAQNAFPAVEIRDLLKAALRHRPDRIMLGEIRGGEAFDLLQLVNTGHSGTLSTIHANSAKQAPARFASCVLQGDIDLPYRAIKNQDRRFAVCLRPHRTPPRTPIHQTEPSSFPTMRGDRIKIPAPIRVFHLRTTYGQLGGGNEASHPVSDAR
jgi:hypothetical protein